MSPSLKTAIHAIRKIEEKFEYEEMKCIAMPNSDGPIFLKANQKLVRFTLELNLAWEKVY